MTFILDSSDVKEGVEIEQASRSDEGMSPAAMCYQLLLMWVSMELSFPYRNRCLLEFWCSIQNNIKYTILALSMR